MKFSKTLLLLVLASFLIFPSCKKGENDPFLSLRSRKNRLSGEWVLKSGSETYQFNSINIQVEYEEHSKLINTNEYPYFEKIIFEKNGEYEWTCEDNNAEYIEKGSWEFGRRNKNKDYKSKETVVLYISEITTKGGSSSETEYFDGDFILLDGHYNIKSIKLQELRNNKLVLIATGVHQIDGQMVEYEMEKVFEQ